MHRLLTIITTMLLSLTAMAQRYPVTVSPVLLPPYTLNLSELTAQGSAKMMATLTVNDLTAVNLPVRLHFKLESAGITVENIPTSAVAPLFLNGGETQILTGADMAQYLRLDNLEFRGYSKDSYRQTGQLPGGLWKVTIEVRHFHTGRVLSNRGAQTLWVSIYDPPVLTAPRNNTEAPDNPSLPLVFSWQASKHTGGTVAVQYKLELWEMRMEGVPAQTVAASMNPVFETTTTVTSYTAIPTIMNLEPGMRYCWRVTVSDPSNQAQINKNGQSEVREFTYLHTCPAVDEVTAKVTNTQAVFNWTPSPYHTHFRVEMLQEGGSSDVSDCYDSKFRLYDFPQGTTWRVRVRGECKGDLEADWSPWTDFSFDPPGTPPTNDECPDCGCDDGPAKREIENYELKELQPGDTIVNRTGRTRFIVLSANATGEGVYSGQFYLWLELWRTKVRCDYTDLKVNTDGVILDGSWRSVHNDGLMVNPATVAENIQNIRNGIANATFDNSISDTIKLGYAIQTIYKDENGRYIAILEDGSEHDLTQDLSTANKTMVEDSQGNKMVVTGDQQLMSAEQYHNTGKNNTLLKNDSQAKDKQIAASGDVVFMPSDAQTYGFDAYDASTNNHPEIYPPLEGGSYRPAYKSVAQWQQDKVAADPMQGVTFRNQMGAPYATTSGDIILRGEPQPGETPVYAHVAETDSTTKVVGKLNLLTFEPREISVCLVPVNGATPPNAQTLEKELNKIFKPAVASVKLSTHSGVKINYADNKGFVHGGSGLLSVYSEDEKAAIKALQNADNDTYYLFVIDNVTRLNEDGTPMKDILAGYMPIGYQCGFLFGSPAAKYVAHELGHGAFGLHHTFSSETESFNAPQYSTDNLMDYADGATLNHKQWTWMHEKHGAGLFGFLADESEGESLLNQDAILSYLKLIHDANAKNQKQLAIPKTNVYFEGEDIQLGDVGKLTFIRIGDITNGKKEEQPLILFYGYNNIFIKPNEISETEIMKDDVKYTKYTFHLAEGVKIPTTEPELTETVALEIMVKSSEKDILKDFLFTNWEYLMTKERLTAAQIAIARDGISTVVDKDEQGRLFQSLQEKVTYHSQRDNKPEDDLKELSENQKKSYKNKTDEEKKQKRIEITADAMCNVTSLAMAFEMLGVSKEDLINKAENEGIAIPQTLKDGQFEDVIDFVRYKKGFDNRTKYKTWGQLADFLSIKHQQIDINSSKKANAKISLIHKNLSNGNGVVMSLFNWKGHIVRVQAINDTEITIDDPFGKLIDLAKRDIYCGDDISKGNYDSNNRDITTKNGKKGEDNDLKWEEIDVTEEEGISGKIEMDGDKIIYGETTFKKWFSSINGQSEYVTREESIQKEDDNGNIISETKKYYKSCGSMIKIYMIFSK